MTIFPIAADECTRLGYRRTWAEPSGCRASAKPAHRRTAMGSYAADAATWSVRGSSMRRGFPVPLSAEVLAVHSRDTECQVE
jgi:hypothetical protein